MLAAAIDAAANNAKTICATSLACREYACTHSRNGHCTNRSTPRANTLQAMAWMQISKDLCRNLRSA